MFEIEDITGIIASREELEEAGLRICNKCMVGKIKPIGNFDVGKKTCRECLARCRQKFECPCGGRYTKSEISHHKGSKKHQKYELEQMT